MMLGGISKTFFRTTKKLSVPTRVIIVDCFATKPDYEFDIFYKFVSKYKCTNNTLTNSYNVLALGFLIVFIFNLQNWKLSYSCFVCVFSYLLFFATTIDCESCCIHFQNNTTLSSGFSFLFSFGLLHISDKTRLAARGV